MRYLSIILWIIFMPIINQAIASELTVKVSNVEVHRGGDMIVMLFSKKGFPKNHADAIHIQTQQSHKEEMEFTFQIELEELAIKVLHDENSDGKVTKNWTGIYPKEGLGFSNKQKIGLTGPPNYKKSKLSKEQFSQGVNISLIYP